MRSKVTKQTPTGASSPGELPGQGPWLCQTHQEQLLLTLSRDLARAARSRPSSLLAHGKDSLAKSWAAPGLSLMASTPW